MAQPEVGGVAAVVQDLQRRLDALTPAQEGRRQFLATYQRTTVAVGEAIAGGVFEDGPWVEAWDVVFADLYDLPQALLAVISDEEFDDLAVLDLRRRDHERIDGVLSGRVAAEDDELAARSVVSLRDRVLQPLNRRASMRFLREAREKVWHNTKALQEARRAGPETYAVRLGELEVLSAARIADLLAPGQVLLRLAVTGFGVVLPPPG